MDKVFLSYTFRDEDRPLVRDVAFIIESYGLRVETGEVLQGETLTAEIQDLIKECDALVAIAVPRDPRPDGRFSTHPWVASELVLARSLDKKAITLRHHQVELEGAYSENEHITYVPEQPAAALVKLCRTLGKWRKADGRTVQALLAPTEDIGRLLSRNPDRALCEYRSVRNGQPSAWRTGFIQREPGGVFAFVNVDDGSLVEIRLTTAGETWTSTAVRQWIRVDLQRESL